jgi:F-type H+-transporting ATPase subunit delta
MAELATIARPYAEAVFRVAQPAKLNAWAEILSEMAQVAAVPAFHEIAGNPRFDRAHLTDIFLASLKVSMDAEAKNLLSMLIENGRLSLLHEIEQQFHELKNAFESTADAQIISAFPMADEQVRDLVVALEKKFGRKLIASVSVDAALIGGVRVTVGDEVLDTSVSARLAHMQTVLAA